MLALMICLLTGLVVWLWLVWDMTREARATWSSGDKPRLRLPKPRAKAPEPAPEPEPEPAPKPARDPRDWMAE